LAVTVTSTPVLQGTATATASPTHQAATATATATAVVITAAPTETPTTIPTETPLAAGWHARGVTALQDSDGDAFVIGEVLNNTGSNQEDISVLVSFFDEDDRQVGETEVWPVVIVVPDGVAVPFEATERLTTGFVRHEVTVQSTASSQSVRQDLELVNTVSSPGPPYVVAGEVGNSGPDLPDAGCAWIIATLYASGGRVAGIGYDGVDGRQLRSGQMADFEVTVEEPLYAVAAYEVVVFGYADCG
jgi:hypothetical protein